MADPDPAAALAVRHRQPAVRRPGGEPLAQPAGRGSRARRPPLLALPAALADTRACREPLHRDPRLRHRSHLVLPGSGPGAGRRVPGPPPCPRTLPDRGGGPEGRVPAPRHRPRRDDPAERGRGPPAHLPGRRAHGDLPVLRPVVPRDDPRVQGPRGRAAREGRLRGMPRGARRGRLDAEQDVGHASADGGRLRHLSAADTLRPGDEPPGTGDADLRAVPLARQAGFRSNARHPQVRRGRSEHPDPDRPDHAGGRSRGGRHTREPHGAGHRNPLRDRRHQAAGAFRGSNTRTAGRESRAPTSPRRPRRKRSHP